MTVRGSHLAAILFADIVEYSDLSARDEARALRLVHAFQKEARSSVVRYGGRVVKFVGDSVLAEFSSTRAAIGAAASLREGFGRGAAERGLGEPRLRIGIHVGDITSAEGDLFGDGVNAAARLQTVADPGEILVSGDVFHQLRQRRELEFEPRGQRDFKGVGRLETYAVSVVEPIEPEAGAGGFGRPDRGVVEELRSGDWLRTRQGRIAAGAGLLLALVLVALVAWWSPWGARSGDAVAGASLDPARIAVLYFDALGEGGELESLANGITESLIHALGGVGEIEVVSRHGVRPYRGLEAPTDSVARALGAGVLIEGSVERPGDTVRVQVRMVDATEGTRIASFTEAAPWSEVFSLQDELVDDISAALRQRLGRELRLEERRRGTDIVEAWEMVQRAERLVAQLPGVREDARVSSALRSEIDDLLRRAEALDPDWIEPALVRGRVASIVGDEAALQGGVEHLDRALDHHPQDPRALAQRGVLRDELASLATDSIGAATQLAGAEEDLRTAVGIDPSLAKAWIGLADLLYNDKWRLPQAKEAARRAYEEDAFLLEEEHFRWLCEISLQMKELNEARRWCAEGRRRYPEDPYLLGAELTRLATPGVEPDPERAWRFLEALGRLPGAEFNVPANTMQVAAVLVRAGLPDSANAVAGEARRRASAEVEPYLDALEAHVRLLQGDRRRSLALLRSFLTVVPSQRSYIARDWWFEPLHGDPRFERLVDRERLPIFCRILCEPPG